MRRSPLAVAVALACAALAASARAQPAPRPAPPDPTAAPSEVRVPNTRQIDFVSAVNGHGYRIQVALPFRPPPAGGYRVLYVLEGYSYFGSATEAVRDNGNADDVVVVGIGYPLTPQWAHEVFTRHAAGAGSPPPADAVIPAIGVERTYDLTLPASDADLASVPTPAGGGLKAADVGGMDLFLRMIETEVKPRVEAIAPVDRKQQALFGHSLGGLAALHALFVEPDAFRTFLIASPSIWWGGQSVLRDEAAFDARVAAGRARPRVLVTVGAQESDMPAQGSLPDALYATFRASFGRTRMVENGRGLATRLKALKGPPPFEVAEYAVFADQGHGLSPWPALGRGVAFAFAKP